MTMLFLGRMMNNKLEQKLKFIYKDEYKPEYLQQLNEMLDKYQPKLDVNELDHTTTYMITYGDIVTNGDEATIDVLNRFVKKHFGTNITDIHLLPMFEYTSDDGFSVVDYLKVDPTLGDWSNINKLAEDYNLMFDFVANHISQSSDWFKGYLAEEEKFANYFIKYDPTFDYSNVTRPRTSPLVSEYDNGKTAWTTFSKDQVDLNYENIDVLVETTRILLEYVANGATSIRLDAIGFLWKQSATTCIHLDETHEVVKLWRIILDKFAPNVQIITETNVPHLENISYYGNNDEAHQVYQFALPPLTLHTFISGDSSKLTEWAKTIDRVSDNATYFNFLASHDGIGMRPTEGILTDDERQTIFNHAEANGAKFNMKSNPDGTESVYEMNVTYFDAIKDSKQTESENIKRFMAAHGILLSLVGVPAIYYNSLLGSTNYYQGVEESGINRRINRQKFDEAEINNAIKDSARRTEVINQMNKLLDVRKSEQLFNPYNHQQVLSLGESVVAIKRLDSKGNRITCLINITNEQVNTDIEGYDIITSSNFDGNLTPYQVAWIK